MDQFKFKPSKIKYQTNITSLDSSHTKFTDNVNKKKELIVKKKNKLTVLEKKLIFHDTNNIKNENYILERISILEEIDNIDNFLSEIEHEELNYYSKTLNILLDYYNFNKVYDDTNNDNDINNINKNNNGDTVNKLPEKNKPDKLSILNEISRNGKKEKKNIKKKNNVVSNNIFNYINDKDEKILKIINKSTLFEDYKNIVDNVSKKIDNDVCISCGANKIIYRNEGIQSCVSCGESDNLKPEVDITNYKDSMIKKPILPYEKKNHFAVWLTQYQARESTEISDEIIHSIKNELIKYRYTDEEIKNLNFEKIKKILKSLKLSKYYKNISHIYSKITGYPPPSFNKEEEELLKKMFNEIQEPYKLNKPSTRKNFLSYSYVLYKFCEKLKYYAKKVGKIEDYRKYDKFTRFFILLKARNKLRGQDILWKKICEKLEWDFYPSVQTVKNGETLEDLEKSTDMPF